MSSGALTFPRTSAARLVVDTDVASFIFKWHPIFAPTYVAILRGSQLIISFMTLAEIRQGVLARDWSVRRREVVEAYLKEFLLIQSDDNLCSAWAIVRSQSARKGRPISAADAWIAATALVLEAPLVTNNPRDYEQVEGLELVSANPT